VRRRDPGGLIHKYDGRRRSVKTEFLHFTRLIASSR
jgi:hypothetical protein